MGEVVRYVIDGIRPRWMEVSHVASIVLEDEIARKHDGAAADANTAAIRTLARML